jgi:hypothetical protein
LFLFRSEAAPTPTARPAAKMLPRTMLDAGMFAGDRSSKLVFRFVETALHLTLPNLNLNLKVT